MRRLCLLLCLTLLLGCCACGKTAQSLQRYQTTDLALFDSVTVLTGYETSKAEFDRKSEQLLTLLRELHQLFDNYQAYEGINNLYTLNQTAGKAPVQVDMRLIELLERGKEYYNLTQGKTNPAMGAVLRLWHDCRTQAQQHPDAAALPNSEALQTAAAHIDPEHIVLDRAAGTVYFSDPALQVDLGALATGYALEQAAKTAEQMGFTSLLLNLGGMVRAVGNKPDGTEWTVGVEDPRDPERFLCTVRIPSGSTLSTSGDYRRYYTVNGVKYHHLIDPDTLYPGQLYRSLSVLCRDSVAADALSTGLFFLPAQQAMMLAKSLPDTEIMLVSADGAVQYSDGFSKQAVAS
ncbi:MAG: FAD:protein FMN transferase [Clostridia bacterium]|nr:FAD:protein FMN transferase [Clostridia bacterium]